MLTEQELRQVREYVIKILPELLRQDPEVATVIEGILAQQFPRRDEFARLLDEIEQARKERERGLAELHSEVGELREEQRRGFAEVRDEMKERFEQVDKRFEQVDKRFEQVDKHFEQVDKRFEQVDKHFEQVDKHLEQVDKHLEQVDKHLEQVDAQLVEIRHEERDARRDRARLQHGHEMILEQIEGHKKWVDLNLGQLRAEKGHSMEDLTAAALRYGLKNPDISADKLRLRQKLVDTDGLKFEPGYTTEVDLIVENDRLIVFEVKSSGRVDDVRMFAWKVELVRLQNPERKVHGVLITLAANDEIRERCAKYGLELAE